MFNLFKKKDAEIRISDKVMISPEAKLNELFRIWEKDKNTGFIFWFDETLEQVSFFFQTRTTEAVNMFTAREANGQQLSGKPIVFGEHYPMHSKELALYEKLGLDHITVYSSLTEPLFKKFGADKIISMMKQLGVKDDEVIEHKMISKSIRSAQEKIEKKVTIEVTATSQSGWLEKNFPAE